MSTIIRAAFLLVIPCGATTVTGSASLWMRWTRSRRSHRSARFGCAETMISSKLPCRRAFATDANVSGPLATLPTRSPAARRISGSALTKVQSP